jgi:predicted PurR-regulated permease PerM
MAFEQARDSEKAPSAQVGEESTAEAVVSRPRASWPLVVLTFLASVAALYFARDVLIPVVLAALLALLLRPLLRRLRSLHLPDALSSLLLFAGVTAVLLLAATVLAGQAQKWLEEAPQTVARVRELLPSQRGPLQNIEETTNAVQDLGRSDQQASPLEVEVKSQDVAYTILGVSGHITGAAVIVIVLGFFLLAFSDGLLRQAVAMQDSFGSRRNIVTLIHEVESGISRYLGTITLINIGLGAATAVVLWMLGIPNPVLWGAMATVANFVPHVGAFACMVVLFAVGAVTHESLGYGLFVAGAFMVLTSIESYFLTPLILSRSLQLSPLAVILAILFWGWLWGIAGGLMAAPLLTIMKIVCDQFPSLAQASAFLAGEPHAATRNGAKGAPAPASASRPGGAISMSPRVDRGRQLGRS